MRRMISEKEFNIIKEAKKLLENIVVNEDGTKVEIGGNVEIDGYVDTTQVAASSVDDIGTHDYVTVRALSKEKCIQLLVGKNAPVLVYQYAEDIEAVGFSLSADTSITGSMNNGEIKIKGANVSGIADAKVYYKINNISLEALLNGEWQIIPSGGSEAEDVFANNEQRTFTPLLSTPEFQNIQDAINGENTITITVTDDDYDENEEVYKKHVQINNTHFKIVNNGSHQKSVQIYNPYFKNAISNGQSSIESFEGLVLKPEKRYAILNIDTPFWFAVFHGILFDTETEI